MNQSTYPLSLEKAQSLRAADTLASLRKKARSLSLSVELPYSPEVLWPLVSHTDFLNQEVGMHSTDLHYMAREYGQTWLHASTKNGGLKVAYEELPYEWSAPHSYAVERIHSSGPLKYLRFGVELTAHDDNTRISCQIDYVSILPHAVTKALIKKELTKFIKAFEKISDALDRGARGMQVFFASKSKHQASIASLSQKWESIEPEAELREALANYILRAPERLAHRIRPFELADMYDLDPVEMAQFCLFLTRENELSLRWDCRCPGCKGPKESHGDLTTLPQNAYCPTCAATYTYAFDQNLELSFQPAPALRKTQELFFCAGGPGNTPHIVWQQNFLAHQTREFDLKLPAGWYQMRSFSCENPVVFEVTASGAEQQHLTLNARITGAEHTFAPSTALTIENTLNHEVTLMIEDMGFKAQALTAARVQALSAFHALFPEQVLPPGQRLPLHRQIFLHGQIQNLDDFSPQTQQELQEWMTATIESQQGACYGQSNQQTHALFSEAFDAMAVAFVLLQEAQQFESLYETEVQLALGMAAGPCEVFSEENHLNYSGPALALTQQALGYAKGLQMVVLEELMRQPELTYFMELPEVYLTRFQSPEGQNWVTFELIGH